MPNDTALQGLKTEAQRLVDATKTLVDKLKAADADAKPDAEQERVLSALLGDAQADQAALAEAVRKARTLRIAQLTEAIDDDEKTLQVPDLDQGTRSTVKADCDTKVAERAQLNAQAASDFAGVLTAEEVQALATLLAAARKEVAQKKKAAAAIAFAMKLADVALSVAAKGAAL